MQVKYTIYVMMQTLITENSGFFLAAKFQAIVIAEASRETILAQNLWDHNSYLLIQG